MRLSVPSRLNHSSSLSQLQVCTSPIVRTPSSVSSYSGTSKASHPRRNSASIALLQSRQLPRKTRYSITIHRTETRSQLPSDVLTETVMQTSPSPKRWTETESDLDDLEKQLKPRQSRRNSVTLTTKLPIFETVQTENTPNSPIFTGIPVEIEGIPKKKQPLKRLKYVNLPKLPFGSHSSYNDDSEFREKIVSHRWKAWMRQRRSWKAAETRLSIGK